MYIKSQLQALQYSLLWLMGAVYENINIDFQSIIGNMNHGQLKRNRSEHS